MTLDFVMVKRDEENVDVILRKYGYTREELKCSICSMDLRDLEHLGVMFPGHSLLICCDKIECIGKCRDKIIE
jgi:hypothetical protein